MPLPSLNVLKLRNRARRESGVNEDDYTDDELLEDFNVAYETLAGILALIDPSYFTEQNVKFDLVQNSALYSTPDDFLALQGLRLAFSGTPSSPSDYKVSTGYKRAEVHLVSADEENIPVSNPIHELTGNFIRIKPTPTVDVEEGGSMDYVAMPSALVNTSDVPVIPINYQRVISDYGAARMEFKYEKWDKYDRHQGAWDKVIAELTQVLADRDLDFPERFKSILEVGPTNNNQRRRELPGR